MLKSKQNKGIVNKQEVIYAEPKFSKSQQQKISKTNQRNVQSREQQVDYMELKFPRSHLQHRKQKKGKVLHHRSIVWQVITASLGTLCVALLTTVCVLLANLYSNKEDRNQKLSPVPTLSSKNGELLILGKMRKMTQENARRPKVLCIIECSCDHCSAHWIGFGSSYYHLSSKTKTWMESHAACEELDTHLLKIDIKGELEILSMLGVKGWIGLKMNETSESWLWEDGTAVTENLFEFLKMEKDGCAYIDGIYVYAAKCSSGKSYVCEFSV
ncbi:killer cell lectin-like receptor subfamily I member 1 isoform X1 [Ovis aries]|uniref:killer cell lectin-like receptor subfamily I member 1 isoform X1 n=1 Tax=Ovis aries TaxID=9940 RepID=UPI0005FB15A0|nr:killer cell lectin-like receptor subfamily I member 1 isoform X1 [Ovis aries]